MRKVAMIGAACLAVVMAAASPALARGGHGGGRHDGGGMVAVSTAAVRALPAAVVASAAVEAVASDRGLRPARSQGRRLAQAPIMAATAPAITATPMPTTTATTTAMVTQPTPTTTASSASPGPGSAAKTVAGIFVSKSVHARPEKGGRMGRLFSWLKPSRFVRTCKPESIIARCSKIDQVHLGKGLPYCVISDPALIDRTPEA
jgi:hypothetical protein